MVKVATEKYIPALGYRWLTPIYDPVVRLATRERQFKSALVEQANVQAGDRILDIGCGSATLAIAIKQSQPQAEVVGLDGDEAMLSMARKKANRAKVDISFDLGLSDNLPYNDSSFDKVVSSLFFHHLSRENKKRTLTEIGRVLKPRGKLYIADWGKASGILMRAAFLVVQLIDGFATTTDNVNGLLPTFIAESGFDNVQQIASYSTVCGTLSLYQAIKS
jgi:ubiquinone/menaquinone biosynthesis C-methylase UbiE